MNGHRMARRGSDELFQAGELPHHGAARFQRGKRAEILGEHLLLGAEASADPFGEDVHLAVEQSEQITKLLLGDERRLRTRPDMQPAVLAPPSD